MEELQKVPFGARDSAGGALEGGPKDPEATPSPGKKPKREETRAEPPDSLKARRKLFPREASPEGSYPRPGSETGALSASKELQTRAPPAPDAAKGEGAPAHGDSAGELAAGAGVGSPGLEVMVLDIVDDDRLARGRARGQGWGRGGEGEAPYEIVMYGTTHAGQSACVRVRGFTPFFWFPAPSAIQLEWEQRGSLEQDWGPPLVRLKDWLNRQLHSRGAHVVRAISLHAATPLMYFRPAGPSLFLKVHVAAPSVVGPTAKELVSLAHGRGLEAHGLAWNALKVPYEEDIKPLMRFCSEAGVAGGGWMRVPGAPHSTSVAPASRISECDVELVVSTWQHIVGLTPDATGAMHLVPKHTAMALSPQPSHVPLLRSDSKEVGADEGVARASRDDEARGQGAGTRQPGREDAPKRAELAPLRVLTVHAICAAGGRVPTQGGQRPGQPANGASKHMPRGVQQHPAARRPHKGGVPGPKQAQRVEDLEDLGGALDLTREGVCRGATSLPERDPVLVICAALHFMSGNGAHSQAASLHEGPREVLFTHSLPPDAASQDSSDALPGHGHRAQAPCAGTNDAFARQGDGGHSERISSEAELKERWEGVGKSGGVPQVVRWEGELGCVPVDGPCRAEVRRYPSEADMLRAWQEFVTTEADPDVLSAFDMRDSLEYIDVRMKALGVGPLHISRRRGHALEAKALVTYSKQWVKQQRRMAATSNQETVQVSVPGRIVIDVKRAVLVSSTLSTFSLAECTQAFLGRTLEVLPPSAVAALWLGHYGGPTRLLRYAVLHTRAVQGILEFKCTVLETIELARATGLPISDILYRAQMVRVQSLLLRASRVEGWLLGGPQTSSDVMTASPFLFHPHENGTAGVYQDPVAILDFSSLYPSLFIAYNLCFTTLLHPSDVAALPQEQVFRAPTGAAFVAKERHQGILPRLCEGLITARKATQKELEAGKKAGLLSAAALTSLDSRQKALKLCSNALYGFTGSNASPQQCIAVADACLSLGAHTCELAKAFVDRTATCRPVLPPRRWAPQVPRPRTADATHSADLLSCQPGAQAGNRGGHAEVEGQDPGRGSPAQPVLAGTLAGTGHADVEGQAPDGGGARSAALEAGRQEEGSVGAGPLSGSEAVGFAKGAGSDEGGANWEESIGGVRMRMIYGQTDSLFIVFPGATVEEATAAAQALALQISALFRAPLALKLERVLRPFLLLQVNRYAGAQAGAGGAAQLFSRGVEVDRRDTPRFVRRVCQSALEHALVQNDVARALRQCRAHIEELARGHVSLGDLVLTGGLWRVDDRDLERIGAHANHHAGANGANGSKGASPRGAAQRSTSPAPGPKGPAASPATAEEGRGPHVALAARLKHRDPERRFQLGERVPYVLLAGRGRLQDEMAEDPVEALLGGGAPNLGVYVENKLRKPLESILEYLAPTNEVSALFANQPQPGPLPQHMQQQQQQLTLGRFFKKRPACGACKKPTQGAALCEDCRSTGRDVATLVRDLHREARTDAQFQAACMQCVRCHSGGRTSAVLCANADCGVLYRRFELERMLTSRMVLDLE